jgi:hypothetical protein
MLTTQQLTTLASAIRADTDQAVIDALAIRNDVALAELYNAATTHVVWRSTLTPEQARAAISGGAGLAQLDNLTAGKRDSLFWVFNGVTQPGNSAQRSAIEDLCGSQNTLKAAILAAQKRVATKAEKLFATGTGSDASPAILGWDGILSHNDVSVALNTNP